MYMYSVLCTCGSRKKSELLSVQAVAQLLDFIHFLFFASISHNAVNEHVNFQSIFWYLKLYVSLCHLHSHIYIILSLVHDKWLYSFLV